MLQQWVICSIADNFAANKSIARLLEVPNVIYLSYKLNSEVQYMISSQIDLNIVIESIYVAMSNCRRRLTNISML